MQSNTKTPISLTKVGEHADAMQSKVADWFGTGTVLLWVPMFDVDESTTTSEIKAIQEEFDGGWLIHRPDDLATLPPGVKGWLFPMDAADTDVVCSRRESEINFMLIHSTSDGELVTFQTALATNARLAAQFASSRVSPSD